MTDHYDTLFICAGFFGYAQEIVSELERRGHRTIWFEDRPGVDTFTKAMVRLSPKLIAHKTEAYFSNMIAQLRDQPIRNVLVIKGEALSLQALHRLRAAFPQARFTLYFWDSYRNMPKGSAQKVDFFDRAFTFDPVDARADSRLAYRPLFYLKEFAALPQVERDIDLLFIGTVHSDRYDVLKRIARAIPPGRTFETYLYFPSRSFYQIKRIVRPSYWGATPRGIIFTPLPKQKILSLMARAKVIVDVERPVQTGYTIRSIEAIAAGRKLVTTNPRLHEADFYRKSNHLYIDRRNPSIGADFLDAPFEELPDHVLARYGVDGWLDDVFECGTPSATASVPDRLPQEALSSA